jgi:hypothetical protein
VSSHGSSSSGRRRTTNAYTWPTCVSLRSATSEVVQELMDLKKKGGPVPASTVARIVTDVSEVLGDELLKTRSDERKE